MQRLIVRLLSLVLILSLTSCKGDPMTESKKVVLIGMDGLDPVILKRMMDQGDLPNFAALAASGTFSPLQTSNPPQSPVAWSCFISGHNPGEHDVFDFIARDPKTLSLEIGMTETKKSDNKSLKDLFDGVAGGGASLQTRRKGKAFWDHLADKGIPSVIVRSPMTFPAESVKGKLLTGMGTPDLKGTQGLFSFYTTGPTGDKDIQGRVVRVQWSGDVIETDLTGLRVGSAGKTKEVTIPVTIKRSSPDKISIEIQGQTQTIGVKEWSNWFRVKYDLGFLKNVYGICRFHLNRLDSELELYGSPVNIDPQSPAMAISYPRDYAGEIYKSIGNYHTQGMPYDTWALNEGRLTEEAFLEQSNHILEENIKMLRMEMGRFKEGLLFCYFGTTDLVSHMFWRYEDPQHTNPGKNKDPHVRNAIAEVYRKMDKVVEEIRSQVDKDTLIVIISDHGFGSFRRAAHINSWLRDNGYLTLVDGDNEGAEFFANVDWSQTQAYAVGFGGVYVNQLGREAKGTVYRGAETQQLKEELAKKLALWKDSNGTPMIKKVYQKEELYSGPFQENGPDLFIGFDAGYRASWQTALGASPVSLVEDNLKMWGGDHLCDPSLVPGVFLASEPMKVDGIALTDVGAVILKYFGITGAVPSQMVGSGKS